MRPVVRRLASRNLLAWERLLRVLVKNQPVAHPGELGFAGQVSYAGAGDLPTPQAKGAAKLVRPFPSARRHLRCCHLSALAHLQAKTQ